MPESNANAPVLRRDNNFSSPIIDYNLLETTWNGRLLPEYKDVVYDRSRDVISSFFDMYMTKVYTSRTTVKHVEQNKLCYTVKAAGGTYTAAGANQPVWVSLNADSMFLGGQYALPQVGWGVALPPYAKQATIIEVDRTPGAMRMRLQPNDPTVTISVSANSVLPVIPANIAASGDCTIFDSTMREPGVVYESTLQTIKRHARVKGEELASFGDDRLFLYDQIDDNGNPVKTYWHQILDDAQDELQMAKYRATMFGESTADNPDAFFTGKKGTTGFMWGLRARGGYHGYSGDFDKTDWRALTTKMIAERNYSRSYTFWQGLQLRQNTDDILDTESAGKVSWGAFGGNEEKWLNYGFKGWTIDGFEFYNQLERNFTDPCGFGAEGFAYNTTGILVPMENVPNSLLGGKPHTHVVMQYLADQRTGYSRELNIRDWGVLKPDTYSGPCDEHIWEFLSTFGVDFYFMNKFYLVEKLS